MALRGGDREGGGEVILTRSVASLSAAATWNLIAVRDC